MGKPKGMKRLGSARMAAHATRRPAASVRQRIMAGGRSHFFASGFRAVTMEQLATELGMSKKTLYQHFADKTALLSAIMRAKFLEVDADLARVVVGASKDFEGALRDLLATMQRHTAELNPAFVRDVQRAAPELFQRVQRTRAEVISRHFGKLLRIGQKRGIIRRDIAPSLAIALLLSMTDGVANPQRVSELGLAPKEIFTAILTIFLEGMVTEKGRR